MKKLIAIVGESGVGKTWLCRKFIKKKRVKVINMERGHKGIIHSGYKTAKVKRTRLNYLLGSIVFFFDLLLRNIKIQFLRLRYIVVCDRYYDLLSMKAPQVLKRLLMVLSPNPTHLFHIKRNKNKKDIYDILGGIQLGMNYNKNYRMVSKVVS